MKFNRKYYENLKIEEFPDEILVDMDQYLYRVKWILNFIKNGSILDLGCNNGLLSLRYAYIGRRVVGVDLSKKAIKFCNNFLKRHHLTTSKYQQGIIEEFKSKEKFDNIFICEVIEHVENPERILEVAEKHLKPDGIIFITTPDYDGLFGINNFGDTDGEHINLFKPKQLYKLINERGKIINFQNRQLTYILYKKYENNNVSVL